MKLLKQLKWNLILLAVLFIALGVVLIVWPSATMTSICYILATILVLLGVVFLIGYLRKDVIGIIYRCDLVIVYIKVDKLTDLVPVVLGFLITISGILKLQNSVDLLRLGHGTWHVAFALAIINIVFGVVLLINPFAKEILITLVGIGFVYSGATDLYVTISISRKLAHVEEEYGEELQNIK